MSMQISVNPAALSQEQREAVAGFILAYPGKACAGSCGKHTLGLEVHVDTTKAVAAVDALAAHANAAGLPAAVAGAVDVELATLQHDHESTLPVAAFGQPVVDEAAAAFGVPAVPLGVSDPLAVSTPAIAAGSIVAPPPPVNTAPITTTPGVVSSAAGVDLDAKGFPWDNRIHASTKRKNADGSWTAKRGVDPALVAQVEAELRQVMGAAPAVALDHAAITTVAELRQVMRAATAAPSAPAVAVPPPAPAPADQVAPSPAAPSGDARAQFVALVGRASAAIQGQKVTQAEVNQCCADAGVPALPLLANRLDLVAQVAAQVDAMIAAR